MTHPQTFAKRLLEDLPFENLVNIEKYGCCAFVLLWCLKIEPESDLDAILMLRKMIKAKVIGMDCTVIWADAVKFLTGKNCTVDFISINDIKDIKERTPVRFDYGGKSHWVGVENGKVAFNPLEASLCVTKGKPASMRKITLKGK